MTAYRSLLNAWNICVIHAITILRVTEVSLFGVNKLKFLDETVPSSVASSSASLHLRLLVLPLIQIRLANQNIKTKLIVYLLHLYVQTSTCNIYKARRRHKQKTSNNKQTPSWINKYTSRRIINTIGHLKTWLVLGQYTGCSLNSTQWASMDASLRANNKLFHMGITRLV